MRWASPPNRREITLLLFSLTIFILAFNLDTSLRVLGLDPGETQDAVLSRLPGLSTSDIATDGRKPTRWRDKLELEIFGEWGWDEGHVAGDGSERAQRKGEGRYGAQWVGRAETGVVTGDVFGHDSIKQVVHWWGNDVPQARIIKHIPGTSCI